MGKLRLFTLLLVVMSNFVAQAEDEPPILHLFAEDSYQTFHITTGTIIEVSLSFFELHVSYDPTKLQFLDYTLPEELTGTVESGVILPEGVAPGMPSSEPGTILPNQGELPPTEIPPETSVGVGSGTAQEITAVPGVIMPAGGGIDFEEAYTTWRFLAIGSGQTSLELITFRPPCSGDQPCVMMPDFLTAFDLVIEGNSIVPEPESIDAEVIVVKPEAVEPTINVRAGQVVLFDIAGLEPPFHVIYHPAALRLLTGETLRFLVNPWGMVTRIGVQTNDQQFAVTIAIEPECDSCGVLPMSSENP